MCCVSMTACSSLPSGRKFTLLTRAIQFPLLCSMIWLLELFSLQLVAYRNLYGLLFWLHLLQEHLFSSWFLITSRKGSIPPPSQHAVLQQLLKQVSGWVFTFLQNFCPKTSYVRSTWVRAHFLQDPGQCIFDETSLFQQGRGAARGWEVHYKDTERIKMWSFPFTQKTH